MIHPINEQFVPKLSFADYPASSATYTDTLIASKFVTSVLRNQLTIREAREELQTYPAREVKLASFDRWLLASLESCGPRQAPFRA